MSGVRGLAAANQQDLLQLSEKAKSSTEYKALHEYVHSKSEAVKTAQDKFCQPVEEAFNQGSDADAIESLLWQAWGAVTTFAANTTGGLGHQERLVDFILSLQTRTTLQKGDQTCKVWDAVVWSDLPVFGAQVREVYNHTPTKDSTAEAKAHWLHFNTFLALLVETAQSKKTSQPDFSLYAIWSIRAGLEESADPADVLVETATVWLTYAASAIYALSKQNKSFEGKLAKPGALYDGKEWTGFSSERWRAWDDRMSQLQDAKVGGKQVEDKIVMARQTMGEYQER